MNNKISQLFVFLLLILPWVNTYAGETSKFGLFYDEPDGVNVIRGYNSSEYGLLYRVSPNLYVQTKNDVYLADIKVLMIKLRVSPTGREILRQLATYVPINKPKDTIAPLIEHHVGINNSKTTVATVIREPDTSTRLFETVPSTFSDPLQTAEIIARQSDGRGVTTTVYFSVTDVVNIPGTTTQFNQTVALGHELIHARDYVSGGMPKGNVQMAHRHPDTQQVTEYSIANAEYQTTGIAHFNNAENGRPVTTELSPIRDNVLSSRIKIYYDWKNLGKEHPKYYLSTEKVVSEFHLADDLGAPKRNTYWPASEYKYHPYTVEARSASSEIYQPNWNTLEGKQAHVEVKRALQKSLSLGKQPSIVIIDATEQSLSRSLLHTPVQTRRALGNQAEILNYAAKNNINVVNIYSEQNETPLNSLKRRKKSKLYIALSTKNTASDSGYADVRYSDIVNGNLDDALGSSDSVLVMAYSDGEITTNVAHNIAENPSREVMVSRYTNLDYQPSNLSPETIDSWMQLKERDNVKMLGTGPRKRFNFCSIQ